MTNFPLINNGINNDQLIIDEQLFAEVDGSDNLADKRR